MKRFFHFMPIAVAMAAAAIISCQKIEEDLTEIDEPTVEEPSIASLTFIISDNESTKTVIADDEGKKYSNWEISDKIGYVTSKSDKGSATVTIGPPATFTISTAKGLAVDDEVEVWYPYRKDETNKASVQMLIPVSQIQDGDSFDFDAMPMVAEPITITSEMLSGDNYAGTINFANLASLIEFKVFSTEGTYASEKVAAITFDAGSGNIAGHFNMNVGAVNFDTPATLTFSGHTANSVTTSLTSPSAIGTSKATAKNVYMVVAPGTYTGNIIVATDAAFYTIPISGKEFERSGFKSFGIDLAKNVATRRSLKGSSEFLLNQISYSSASETAATWNYGLFTLSAAKASAGTPTNNYMPPAQTSTRFYKNSSLAFTPAGLQIEKVEYTATKDSYATDFAASTWSNASASAVGSVVTVIPNDGSATFTATSISNTTGATSIKVYYDNNNYTISGTSLPAEGGSFTIKKGDDVVTSAKVNTTITLIPSANPGYYFSGWTVKDEGDNDIAVSTNQFQMPASNVTITADFAVAGSAHTINISPCLHGTVSTSPVSSTTAGTTVTITAIPETGYEVISIDVKDSSDGDISVNSSNEFSMPDDDVTVTVVFGKIAVLSKTTFTSAGITLTTNATTEEATSTIDGISVTYNGVSHNAKNTPTGSGKTDDVKPAQGQLVLLKKDGVGKLFNTSSLDLKKIIIELTGTAYNSASCNAPTVSSKSSSDPDYSSVVMPSPTSSTRDMTPASGSTPITVNTFIYEIDMTGKNFFKIVSADKQINIYSVTVVY